MYKAGASQVALVVKNPPAIAGNMRHGFNPWVRKIPWRREWQPTAVFLPAESQGYSPQGHTELDTTKRLSTCTKLNEYEVAWYEIVV